LRIEHEHGAYRAVSDQSSVRLRVMILCSDDPQHDYLRRELAARLQLVGTVVEPSRAQQAKLWRRSRRVDWVARYYHGLRQRITGRARYRARYFASIGPNPASTGPVLVVSDINSDDVGREVRCRRPDVIVVCGTTWIDQRVTRPAGLAINIHCGYLPDYRGNHCIFFAYYKRDYCRIAATLHVVSPRLDGGDVIEVVRPEVLPHDNDEHLYSRCAHVGIFRLAELLTALDKEETLIRAVPQATRGTMYRHRSRKPHLDGLVWLRRRLGFQAVPHLRCHRAAVSADMVGSQAWPRFCAAGADAPGGCDRCASAIPWAL
jgi:methionyl-tRNA formyltransferase